MKKTILALLVITLFSSAAIAQTQPRLRLNWNDNSANEDGFRIERGSTLAGPFTALSSVSANVTTYDDLNLAYSTQYCYRVASFNTAGQSAWSNVACATTAAPPDTTPPTIAITSPSASGSFTTSASSVTIGGTASDSAGVTDVSWVNDRGGAGKATGTGNWQATVILQPGANVVTVTASDAAGNKTSAKITVTYNPITIPIGPSGLTLSAISSSTIELSWNDNADNETSQEFRWRSWGPPRTGEITMATDQVSYRMSGLKKRTTYCGKIVAIAGNLESNPSNESCATTRR